MFTAQEPEGVGPEKYDETAAAMIAQLKYGSGVPFYRLEPLEAQLGIPLPLADAMEDRGASRGVAQTGTRPVDPASGTRRGAAQRRYQHAVLKLKRPEGTSACALQPSIERAS